MTTKRYIFAWAVIAIITGLVIMALNNNLEKIWINVIGIVCILILQRYSSRLFPEWMKEYFRPKEMDDRFDHN